MGRNESAGALDAAYGSVMVSFTTTSVSPAMSAMSDSAVACWTKARRSRGNRGWPREALHFAIVLCASRRILSDSCADRYMVFLSLRCIVASQPKKPDTRGLGAHKSWTLHDECLSEEAEIQLNIYALHALRGPSQPTLLGRVTECIS